MKKVKLPAENQLGELVKLLAVDQIQATQYIPGIVLASAKIIQFF